MAIHDIDVAERKTVRQAAQWRLDFPIPHGRMPARNALGILSVAESLLARGTTPYCFTDFDKAISADITKGELHLLHELQSALRQVTLAPTCAFRPLSHVFDSVEEEQAAVLTRGHLERTGLPWQLIPQIRLASLAPFLDAEADEHGDLLLVHPERAPILLEVDGLQHDAHTDSDSRRDSALAAAGVVTMRIPAAEARGGAGPTLAALMARLDEGAVELPAETGLSCLARWCKFAHQVQLALISALRIGMLPLDQPWKIGIVLPELLRNGPSCERLATMAVCDLRELLAHLGALYGHAITPDEPVVVLVDHAQAAQACDVIVGPADGTADNLGRVSADGLFLISDLTFPADIRAPFSASPLAPATTPRRDDAEWIMRYIFRKEQFREGQWETVSRSLRGLDSVVLLPTGAGKSLAFQLSALLRPGRCIVVDPIISLIEDQIDNLDKVGIDRCVGISGDIGSVGREKALESFRLGHHLFCYVAPERFQDARFREALVALTTSMPVSLIAIDEAHCVSEWGHDFRTAYLNLGRITRQYCSSNGAAPPLLALTGTASKIVLKEVQRELGITSFDAIITPKSFDRSELHFSVYKCTSREKSQRLVGFLRGLPEQFGLDQSVCFGPLGNDTKAGLVFCPHVRGEYGTDAQARQIEGAFRTKVLTYSGGAAVSGDPSWSRRKRQTAKAFKRNEVAVMACTKAFGMGIDKENIRYTVHINLPQSIESFYQEAGRAGRDRDDAFCSIILSNDYPTRTKRLLSPDTPLEEVQHIVDGVPREEADDVIRVLWFHLRAFRGVNEEIKDIRLMIEALGDVQKERRVNLSWLDPRWQAGHTQPESPKMTSEKALHRLVVLGVVRDYTVSYASSEFSVTVAGASSEDIAAAYGKYAGAYQTRLRKQEEERALAYLAASDSHADYVVAVAELLINFLYQHVERARRSALSEMFAAADNAESGSSGDAYLRQRILQYLESSEWDDDLERVYGSETGGIDEAAVRPILDNLVSPNDAGALRGAVARILGSYPDVPGLLMLRSLAEAMAPDADGETAVENLRAGLRSAFEKYGLARDDVAYTINIMLERARDRSGAAERLLAATLAWDGGDRELIRCLTPILPPDLARYPVLWLNARLASRTHALLNS